MILSEVKVKHSVNPEGDAKDQSGAGNESQHLMISVTECKAWIEKLKEKLPKVVKAVHTVMNKNNIDVFEACLMITDIPMSHRDESQKLLKATIPDIAKAASLNELFLYLNFSHCWNYLNFDLLKRIIKRYGDDETKQMMEEYETEVTDFRKKTSVRVFWEANDCKPIIPSEEIPPNVKEYTVKRDWSPDSKTLEDVEKLREEIASELYLYKLAIHIYKVLLNTVEITFLVPSFALEDQEHVDAQTGATQENMEHPQEKVRQLELATKPLSPEEELPVLRPELTSVAMSGRQSSVYDVGSFVSIDRRMRREMLNEREEQRKSQTLNQGRSVSIDNLYTGKMVTELRPGAFTIKIGPRKWSDEIIMDLDLQATKESMAQLKLAKKPKLSKKAWKRLSSKNRSRVLSADLATPDSTVPSGTELRVLPTEVESVPVANRQLPLLRVPEIREEGVKEEEKKPSVPQIPLTHKNEETTWLWMAFTNLSHRDDLSQADRESVSTDSGLGDDLSQTDRESVAVGDVMENSPTTFNRLQLMAPNTSLRQQSHLRSPTVYESLRVGTKHHRQSMKLSDLSVVTVSVPADIAQGQKGRGVVLKFRFSPFTQIEFLRIAILKQFHERCETPVTQLSTLHLCRYLEDEEGWEWLEEDHGLHAYQLSSECKLELKPLEPVYRDVRVVIPQLECNMSVEYDQFSTVENVLHQVLSLAEPPLDPAQGYALFHIRLRMYLDSLESMVHYQILPTDVLECRLSIGKLHSVTLTVKIPSIQSFRKVKVCLDETVGELISTLMHRVPDPDSPRWTHVALYLHSREPQRLGIWMDDYKLLAAYKLKASDVIEFRPKYRPMTFELRVYPHDHYGDSDWPYASLEQLVAQDTLVSEVIELLYDSASLEYDPHFYGLFLHDDTQLPSDISMWDHLDEVAMGYQDSLVMHMVHKPVQVSFQGEEESYATLNVDFSQSCRVLRDILCRRYGVRYPTQHCLQYEGILLNPSFSLHNQGVLEQEHLMLTPGEDPEFTPLSRNGGGAQSKRRNSAKPTKVEDDLKRTSMTSLDDDVNIWDEGPDTELNLRFDQKRPGVIVGATFNKLVERITSSRDLDLEFVKTFLYTYQSFSTSERLFLKLIERYNVVRPEGVSFREFAVMRQTIQARVINALRLWVDLSVDFKDNPALQDEVLKFINTVLIMDHPRLCRALRTNILTIKGVIQKKKMKMFRDPPPPVKFPTNPSPVLSIFDFDPEEMARQMTIIDFSLFAKIKPSELLNQAWQKAKYQHRAVNVLTLVERMNNLTLWVATTILSQRDAHQRAKIISDFVQVSLHLLHMHNYSTLMSVLNGLADPSITRLKKSFSKLDKFTNKKLDELQPLARPANNFKLLRDELKRSSNPSIPYLGLYMSDLKFLDIGNPNFHCDGLINFSKCRLIYHQIRDLVLRQDKPYNYEEVPALHESLIKFHFLDTDVLYDVSLQREPRDKGK